MEQERKKVIFSGMQPSGSLTIGNYLGALKNWVNLQDEYNCLYCVVDMHSLTVRNEAAKLRQASQDVLLLYIAAGLDPEKNIVYYQSHVPAHAQLAWVLNCYTYMGELNRMTQFKEKSARHAENINAGLFTYPVLMAADILLYQTDLVPVGEDQRQHLELARDIAIRFNNIYGDVFTVPEGFIPKAGARIMGLQEPEKKMSKSGDSGDAILLLDEPNVIMNKIKRAVTDSETEVRYDPINKPGVSNLLNIYSVVTGNTMEQSVNEFAGKGYGDFKRIVGEAVVEELRPIQERFKELKSDKAYVKEITQASAERANSIARRTLNKVHRKVGMPGW